MLLGKGQEQDAHSWQCAYLALSSIPRKRPPVYAAYARLSPYMRSSLDDAVEQLQAGKLYKPNKTGKKILTLTR